MDVTVRMIIIDITAYLVNILYFFWAAVLGATGLCLILAIVEMINKAWDEMDTAMEYLKRALICICLCIPIALLIAILEG